jgi:4-oxalocrotonate tautomerase
MAKEAHTRLLRTKPASILTLNLDRCDDMPILTIQVPSGLTREQKTDLLEGLTAAVQASLGAPLSSIRCSIIDVSTENTIVAGELGLPSALIQIALIEGRSADLKAALIAALAKAVEQSAGISAQDTRILIQDYSKADLGVAGGISALAAGR